MLPAVAVLAGPLVADTCASLPAVVSPGPTKLTTAVPTGATPPRKNVSVQTANSATVPHHGLLARASQALNPFFAWAGSNSLVSDAKELPQQPKKLLSLRTSIDHQHRKYGCRHQAFLDAFHRSLHSSKHPGLKLIIR